MKPSNLSAAKAGLEQQKSRQKWVSRKRNLPSKPKALSPRADAVGAEPFLELYQKEDCPFSHAVRRRLTRLGLDFVAHNVPDNDALKHKQLRSAGGKDQIPFLIDHRSGAKLYESGVILTYLETEYGVPQSNRILKFTIEMETRVRGRADQIAWVLRQPLDIANEARSNLLQGLNSLRRSLNLVRVSLRRNP